MLTKLMNQYDSEEDENYEPTDKEKRQYDQEHMRKSKRRIGMIKNVHELFLEMKKEYEEEENKVLDGKRRKTEKQLENTVDLATSILNSDSIKPNKRITFAGKQYLLNEETGQLELVEKVKSTQQSYDNLDLLKNPEMLQEMQIKNRHVSFQYLNHIMQAIYYRSKKINAVGKSKLDWKGFVKQQGIEDKLKYNRKGGVLQNMQFMSRTN